MRYRIEYSPEALEHLRAFKAHDQRVITDDVDEQLTHQPLVETRNRKEMRPNPLAPWELRIGKFRAYYDVDEKNALVEIVAIGVKWHNKVFVGGLEIDL